MNYNNKKFKPISSSDNGEVSEDIVFHYYQIDNILTCDYSGGNILKGHLLGKVDQEGNIEMRYHQLNLDGKLMTGICTSTPKLQGNGRIRLIEKWRWTSGTMEEGNTILEEI